MRANVTALSVYELRETIGLWKSRRTIGSAISKLPDLYLGVTAYVSDEAICPVENFYGLGLSLKFKNARCLVEAVRQSRSFGIVPDGNVYGMKSLYSYLWKAKDTAEDLPETLPEELPRRFPQASIYNYNTYNNYKSTKDIPKGDSIPAGERLKTARHFFYTISKNPVQKLQIFIPLIDRFQQEEGLARGDTRTSLIYLVNESLVPRFAGQERFMKSGRSGCLCWLNNLLRSAHGQHLLKDAATAGRRKREQAIREMRSEQHNNHPLYEFEWTDTKTEMRFYDDPIEGVVNIPDDASPCPGAGNAWNMLSNNWEEEDS